MASLLDHIGKFRTLSDEEFDQLIHKPQKQGPGSALPDHLQRMNDAFTQRYLQISMEDFIEKYMRQRLAGISREDILKLVHDTCLFFGQDDSCRVYDVSHTPLTTQMRSSLNEEEVKDELYYNLEELIRMGVTTVDAFTLVLTHEFAHRYFKHKVFYGRNHGAWEMELACDFFAGVRSEIDGIHTTGMRWSLGKTVGTRSHPPGFLRLEFIQYARSIVYKCSLRQKKVTFTLCLGAYNRFLESKAGRIWEEQQRIIWENK